MFVMLADYVAVVVVLVIVALFSRAICAGIGVSVR
jgi:hypothetical protein